MQACYEQKPSVGKGTQGEDSSSQYGTNHKLVL